MLVMLKLGVGPKFIVPALCVLIVEWPQVRLPFSALPPMRHRRMENILGIRLYLDTPRAQDNIGPIMEGGTSPEKMELQLVLRSISTLLILTLGGAMRGS